MKYKYNIKPTDKWCYYHFRVLSTEDRMRVDLVKEYRYYSEMIKIYDDDPMDKSDVVVMVNIWAKRLAEKSFCEIEEVSE